MEHEHQQGDAQDQPEDQGTVVPLLSEMTGPLSQSDPLAVGPRIIMDPAGVGRVRSLRLPYLSSVRLTTVPLQYP